MKYTYRITMEQEAFPPAFIPDAILVLRIKQSFSWTFIKATNERHPDGWYSYSAQIDDTEVRTEYEFGWLASGAFLILAPREEGASVLEHKMPVQG